MIGHNEAGWVLARIWVDALEETARDFFGENPRPFMNRAYQHAAESWIRALSKDYGIQPKRAGSIMEAVTNYVDMGVRTGLLKDYSDCEVEEINPHKIAINMRRCTYHDTCCDLAEQGISIKNLTCPRMGCFAAAVGILAGIPCEHYLNQVQLSDGCRGTIEKV